MDTKWVFLKKGTCSRTLFYIMNREFGNPHEDEERAIDPMAGGIMQNGYQCGQLWGASAAVGLEAYRRFENNDEVIEATIKTTQNLLTSFERGANTVDCEDYIGGKVENGKDALKMFVTGKFIKCFKLADKWTPEAIRIAKEDLDNHELKPSDKCRSCASDVVKMMGGSDKHAAMVSGWAGGLGLSGGGCGAVSAAIWFSTYLYEQEHGKSTYPCAYAQKVLNKFLEIVDYEFECKVITEKNFSSLSDHSNYIKEGGCKELIESISSSSLRES